MRVIYAADVEAMLGFLHYEMESQRSHKEILKSIEIYQKYLKDISWEDPAYTGIDRKGNKVKKVDNEYIKIEDLGKK